MICSHFYNYPIIHHQPKPEVTVITNVAAINMEEVIPLNVNDSNLLAPEEIYDKKAVEVKGETELTSVDKKIIRVKKKRAKKKAKKMREREEKVMEKYVSLIFCFCIRMHFER